MSLYETIGARIKHKRTEAQLSQEQLGKKVGEPANTISRWESATYKPTVDDLERIAHALGASITDFLPPDSLPQDRSVAALLRTAKGLDKADLKALRDHADWLAARHVLQSAKTSKRGRDTT